MREVLRNSLYIGVSHGRWTVKMKILLSNETTKLMGKLALRHNSLRSVSAASLLVKRPSPPLHSNCILYIFIKVFHFIFNTKNKSIVNFAISGNNWCTQLQIDKIVINVKLVFCILWAEAQVSTNIWQGDFVTTGKVENPGATWQFPDLDLGIIGVL